jgi:hypothetical protein
MTPSRPSLTATPMTGNSGALLEHLASVAVCKTVGLGEKVGFASWNLLFSQMGPRWEAGGARGSEPWAPQPAPGPPSAHRGAWRLAARGGERGGGGGGGAGGGAPMHRQCTTLTRPLPLLTQLTHCALRAAAAASASDSDL